MNNEFGPPVHAISRRGSDNWSRDPDDHSCHIHLTMKIILSGSTGFVGQEVLHQCISKHSITDIIVLVRRRLPESSTKDRRVKVILMTDFTSYPEHVLQDLAGAEACIW